MFFFLLLFRVFVLSSILEDKEGSGTSIVWGDVLG